MGRTSIKNKLILSFLALLLIVTVVVGVVNRLTDDFFVSLAVSTAMALAAGIVFGSIFSRSLVSRMNGLSAVAREVSRGDLSKEIPILSRDEVRDLEEVFGAMVKDLRAMIGEMMKVSSQIQETNKALRDLTGKVLENSQRIGGSAEEIAKGSEKQTLIVHEVSIALDNGLEQMEDMARQSSQTVNKISEAHRKTREGEQSARKTMSFLEEVLKQMVEYATPVYRLSGKVEKIRMVMAVLNEVAQKTDLLSLNASIEATRAGAMGKGFALVADEIRTMAENSRHSSYQVSQIVEDIFEDNKAVMESLRKTEERISRGRELIHGIVATLSEMLTGVQSIALEVKEVEEVTRKQTKQMRGLLHQFQDLSRLAQENFLSTQKTTISTRNQEEEIREILKVMASLGELSERMIESQRHFRI